MDKITQAYLDGLYAAALICQDKAGDKNSHYSDAIMKFRATHEMKARRDAAIKLCITPTKADILDIYTGYFTD